MKKKTSKISNIFEVKFHIACTKPFNDKIEEAARSKSMKKSVYIRSAIELQLKKDGF